MNHVLTTDNSGVWSHEESYKGRGLVAMIHRNRLRHALGLFRYIDIPHEGTLADYGCSDGFILSLLQKDLFREKDWQFRGYDHAEALLLKGQAKNLPNTRFQYVNLNDHPADQPEQFDIVTCFETLEHTGNVRNALRNLYASCKIGGRIILTIPNEKGLPGLLKFGGRKLLRKNVYGDFFQDKSEWDYLKSLVFGRPLDVFREPPAAGWGPHLGFDYLRVEAFIQEQFVQDKKLKVIQQGRTTTNFTKSYILQRLG